MTYENKTPPIKLILEPDNFNKLLNFLNKLEIEKNEKVKEKAKKLKDKIIKYSVPFSNQENKSLVDTRFFISEASDLLFMLIQENNTTIELDYYQTLLNIKEKKEIIK